MKKVGDKVRIKSRIWYDLNEDQDGRISKGHGYVMNRYKARYCGMTARIIEVRDPQPGLNHMCQPYKHSYKIDLDGGSENWQDFMFKD